VDLETSQAMEKAYDELLVKQSQEKKKSYMQNFRQKVFNRRALRLCKGAWHSKFHKNSTDL